MATSVAPYLCVKGASNAIEFYVNALGAEELYRLSEPSGRIGHAEIRIGNSIIMLADEFAEYGFLGPQEGENSPIRLQLEVDDVDTIVARAIALGAREVSPVKDEFYGDRAGRIQDPFGHHWLISTRKEEISVEEMQRRYNEMLGAGAGA